METKIELLQKLGFSANYLKIIESENQNTYFQKVESSINFIETNNLVNEITTLIIDKSAVPINTHFIYNEK